MTNVPTDDPFALLDRRNGSQVLLAYGALTIANTAGTSTTFDGVISDGWARAGR